jgi:hypothetical protein
MGPRGLRPLVAALVAGACLLAPPGAGASFHLMQVREVYPGSAADPEAEYVELQMWSGGENFVGGHFVRSYDATGAVVATSTFPANVPDGANQSTLVLATAQAEARFGIIADAALAPAGQLSPGGGAVCWEAIDCVSWGSFAGTLPSPAGTPATPAGIPDGMALGRSLARACATLLDPADDSDNSAADFAAVSPAPRPNSVPPSERSCASSGPGGGTGGSPSQGKDAPQTTLHHKPPKRSADRTPTFRFTSDARGARFECKLDARRYRRCSSPFTTRRLGLGPHRVGVRAVDDGLKDPTPASYRFTVVQRSQ